MTVIRKNRTFIIMALIGVLLCGIGASVTALEWTRLQPASLNTAGIPFSTQHIEETLPLDAVTTNFEIGHHPYNVRVRTHIDDTLGDEVRVQGEVVSLKSDASVRMLPGNVLQLSTGTSNDWEMFRLATSMLRQGYLVTDSSFGADQYLNIYMNTTWYNRMKAGENSSKRAYGVEVKDQDGSVSVTAGNEQRSNGVEVEDQDGSVTVNAGSGSYQQGYDEGVAAAKRAETAARNDAEKTPE